MKSKFPHLLSCLLGPKILIDPNLPFRKYKKNIQDVDFFYIFHWVNASSVDITSIAIVICVMMYI